MAKKKARKQRRKKELCVVIKATSYGAKLKGEKIYWEGKRPQNLQDDGRIGFGKNILEALKAKAEKVRWIITEETTSVEINRGILKFRTSQKLLKNMNKELFARTRDIKQDIIARLFSIHFPSYFAAPTTATHVPGTLANTLDSSIIPRLTGNDKAALNAFLPDYAAAESVATIGALKATAEIKTLKATG